MRHEVSLYVYWYNDHRPHQGLDGKTPYEVYQDERQRARSYESRPRVPTKNEAVRVKRIQLILKFLEGRRHLPIVELKRAA
jgi:hypothetical protein